MKTASTAAAPGELDERRIVEWLREHRDFFVRNPKLLADLDVPHGVGTAHSLIERQVGMLRQENTLLRSNFDEWIGIARDNERLATHLFDLARALITARDLAEVAESVASIGTEALGADAIALCLFADAPDSAPAATSLHWLARDPALEAIARDEQILCGPIDVARAALLFRSQTPEPQSAALIGIGGDVPRGVLAIGSAEPGRYGAEAATDFLAELGRLVATATSLHWARTPAPA